MKKLLIIGMNSVHTYNFIQLIEGYFDEVMLITDSINEKYSGNSRAIDFSVANSWRFLSTVSGIKKTVLAFQPSVIHIHQANTAAWFVLRAIRALQQTSIVTAWGSDILINPERGFFYRKMVEQILKNANYFTADARFLAEKMKQLSKNDIAVEVINFGIDPIFKSTKELETFFPQKENIIYSNRLHKKLYRIDHIIKAFALFSKQNNKAWKLVIAATGVETENLQQLVHSLGIEKQVAFAGWVNAEENATWYRKAKIFVSYPESDATSVSLLEGMSAGCIPLLSDLPANREWITNHVNGIVTEQLSANDFQNAMQLCNPQTAVANIITIQKKATKALSRKLFLDLYDRAIAHS
ncbi:MAG: glycosyltransferase family 4 protein [Chitinophagaceae bacterium]|nr:glycosyltransferase family 4 protein [Chitinophagaceae bacterium]